MTPKHFIAVLIDAYEAAWSAIAANAISTALRSVVLETAIHAACAVEANNWHGQGERARLVAGALVRARFGETAAAEAAGLSAGIALAVALSGDPPTREALTGTPTLPL